MPRFRSSAWVALLAAVAMRSEAQGRALRLEDYYALKTIGFAQISPDGRWVTYTVSRRIEQTNGDSVEVWIAATDGASQPRRVSAAGANASAPQWSDDNELTFFQAARRWTIRPERADAPTESPVTQTARGERRLPSANGRMYAVLR